MKQTFIVDLPKNFIERIESCINNGFTGNITLHFNEGGLLNWDVMKKERPLKERVHIPE